MLRQVVPVRGSILGHNYYDSSDRDIGYGALGLDEGQRQSDILPYSRLYCPDPAYAIAIPQNTHTHVFNSREFYIRYAKPHFARILEAYLDFRCTFSGNNGVKIVFGDCDALLAPQTLSRSQIDDLWRKATSKSASLSGNGSISFTRLSLKNIIPKNTDEIFSLCLAFDSIPQNMYIEKINLLLGTELLV